MLTLPFTKAEISYTTGKAGCSMAAITDIGLASSLVSALAEEKPEVYAEAARRLAEKNSKARQRKQPRAQERNKKTGKRRTDTKVC